MDNHRKEIEMLKEQKGFQEMTVKFENLITFTVDDMSHINLGMLEIWNVEKITNYGKVSVTITRD